MTRREAEKTIRELASKHSQDHATVIRFCETCHCAVGCLTRTQTTTHTAGNCGGRLLTMRNTPAEWIIENAEKALAWAYRMEAR